MLCDCTPRWVPVSGNQIPQGAFVGGQTESGEMLYVGRAHHEGTLTTGKVSLNCRSKIIYGYYKKKSVSF